jgi:hypothetical protein
MLTYKATTGVGHKKRVREFFRVYNTAKDLLDKLQGCSELISINKNYENLQRERTPFDWNHSACT